MMGIITNPLFWLTVTLATYKASDWLYHRLGCHPLLSPVLLSVLILIGLLKLTSVRYQTYFDSVRILYLLLGPTTVALAIPLYNNLKRIRALMGPLLIALSVGGLTAIFSTVGIGFLFGLTPQTLLSLSPRSVTLPIAIAIADKLDANLALTTIAVIITGTLGSTIALFLVKILKVQNEAVAGFAMGLSSHGVGTACAFQISNTAGAFSGLGMSMNGIFTALMLPVLLSIWPIC